MTVGADRVSRAQPDVVRDEQVLVRQLSGAQQTMMALGGAIGTGLFLASGLAVNVAGPAIVLSYAIVAIIALLLGAALAEMAVAHPTAGAPCVELDRNRADAALEGHDRPTGQPPLPPEGDGGAEHGMAGEGQLDRRREDPDAGVAGGRVRRRVDVHRLAEADLARQVLPDALGHL